MMYNNISSLLLHASELAISKLLTILSIMFSPLRTSIYVLALCIGFFGSMGFSYAADKTPDSRIEAIVSTGVDSGTISETEDHEKVKQDIHAYIIESYKTQGTKILKDLDIKLQKSIPDKAERKEAYKKIRSSLDLRKKRIESLDTSTIKKEILSEFLDHMISTIDKRISELE